MKLSLLKFISMCLIVALSACEYEPVKVNFQNVNQTAISSVDVSLQNFGDTVVVGTKTTVGYALAFPKEVKFILTVLLDGKVIHKAAPDAGVETSESGSFIIDPADFEDGYYPLKFQVDASTGTMSLSDRLGLERTLLEYNKKIVHIDLSAPEKINITSVVAREGGLYITWPRYPRANLKELVLYESVLSSVTGLNEFQEFHFKDINQTLQLDTAYLGGKATFFFVATTLSGNFIKGDEYIFEIKRPEIVELKSMPDNMLEIKWRKSQFPNAFGEYYLANSNYNSMQEFYSSTNISDTSVVVQFPFGTPLTLELRTLPKGANKYAIYNDRYGTRKEVYYGDKIPGPVKILAAHHGDRAFYYNYEYIYALDQLKTKPEDSVYITTSSSPNPIGGSSISPNGQYFYVSTGQSLVRLDPNTLSKISEISMKAIFSGTELYPFALVVNDNNQIVVDLKTKYDGGTNFGSSFIGIINGQTSAVTDTIKTKGDQGNLFASSDGRFVYSRSGRMMYEISATGVEVRRGKTNNYSTPVFKGGATYLFSQGKTEVFDLTSFTTTGQQSNVFLSNPVLDAVTNYVGARTDSKTFSIIDPSTSEIKRSVLFKDQTLDYNEFSLSDHYLYSEHGYRLKID